MTAPQRCGLCHNAHVGKRPHHILRAEAELCLYCHSKPLPSGDHEIADIAGWDMFIRYRDKVEGIRYFQAAVEIPGAPIRLQRFLTAWREDEEGWSIEDAISYWVDVRDSSEDDYNRAVSERQIYRLVASRDEAVLDPVLQKWKLWHGRCPDSWQEVVDAGFLSEIPVDYFGRTYRILPESCSAMGEDEVRFD